MLQFLIGICIGAAACFALLCLVGRRPRTPANSIARVRETVVTTKGH